MTATWDPVVYRSFAGERGRPYVDLLARVGAADPAYVVDLGCGPGDLTASLAERWPQSMVHGVDSSDQMIDAARATARLSFERADLRTWRPDRPVDVLLSNATLQWVPGHLDLLPQLVGWLAPSGWLAVQVPANFGEPSHRILHELAADPRFRAFTARAERPSSHDARTYLRALQRLGLDVDAWETTYLHVLDGPDPVLRWISGTGARPVLHALPDGLRAEFEQEYGAALRAAYPEQNGCVVMPFRRVFFVAHKAES
ncbi:MAG: methyltransferase domain-containing protein [Propionibacteriales bacterium]|nr:methyltransferase domain-containing protein [Propionibacteriales bacterium]